MMKEYLNYTRLFKTRPPKNIGFMRVLVFIILVFSTHNYLFGSGNGFAINFMFLVTLCGIIFGTIIKNMNDSVTFASTYPISIHRRVLYHVVYAIYSAIIGMLIVISIFLAIFSLFWLFNPTAIDYNDVGPGPITPLFYYALYTSLSSFFLLIGHIKKNHKYKIITILGLSIYGIILMITAYIFNGHFNPYNLFETIYNHQNQLIHYILSGLLFVTPFIFYAYAIHLNKPKSEK